MTDRRSRVKLGLGAVLKSTAERARPQPDEPFQDVVIEPEPEPPPEPTRPRLPGRPRSVTRLRAKEGKRHTSVYLYPAEFDLLDDMVYDLRRKHGVRIPKTELWRALLHLASTMLADPERVDALLEACISLEEEK